MRTATAGLVALLLTGCAQAPQASEPARELALDKCPDASRAAGTVRYIDEQNGTVVSGVLDFAGPVTDAAAAGYLTLLYGAKEIGEAHTEVLRGVPTRRHHVVVDRDAVLDKAPEAKRFLRGLRHRTFDVWVDRTGLVHRVRDGARTVDFYDYGT